MSNRSILSGVTPKAAADSMRVALRHLEAASFVRLLETQFQPTHERFFVSAMVTLPTAKIQAVLDKNGLGLRTRNVSEEYKQNKMLDQFFGEMTYEEIMYRMAVDPNVTEEIPDTGVEPEYVVDRQMAPAWSFQRSDSQNTQFHVQLAVAVN